VLAVLVAGGVYLPRNSKTEARQGEAQPSPPAASPSNAASPDATQQTTPPAATLPTSPTPDSPPPTPPESGISNAAQSSPVPARIPPRHTVKLNPNGTVAEQPASPPQSASESARPDKTSDAIDPDELERQIDQLSSRAAAVNSSLDRLQQQQSMAGYGLRGDMAARQASMKTNLSKAQSAAERGDLPKAKKYADMAASDAEALEHFLGH